MLSILIPTYNYNAFLLVNEIQKQAKETGIEFEIICMDDGSKVFLPENKEINSLENCSFEILKNNVGRSAIRNLLAKKASFDNLLYLDSDTIPVANDFISKYLFHINEEEKIVYGGIQYQKEKPKKSQLLRWKYGHSREALCVKTREENPYLRFLTLNFMIKKSVFEKVNFNETIPNLRHEDSPSLSFATLGDYSCLPSILKGIFPRHWLSRRSCGLFPQATPRPIGRPDKSCRD